MTAPVKLTKRARIIAAPVLVLVLALAVFAAHQLRRELTACFEWPDVELLVEDEPPARTMRILNITAGTGPL